MKIPTYERQIIKKAVPKVAPTPVFEAQRSNIQSKQNVFNSRSNLTAIANNKALREKGYELQSRGLELQEKKLDSQNMFNMINLGLQGVQAVVQAVETGAKIYQGSVDAEAAKAIEIYNQEMQLYNNEIERKDYILGDEKDIAEQYGELTTFGLEAHDNALEKSLDGIKNEQVQNIVSDYAKQNNRERMQQQWFKFQDAKKQQSRNDLITTVNSATERGDSDAVDNYLRIGVQDGLFTPQEADKLDAASEKIMITAQLKRGVTSIFENGGDLKNARDWVMQYDPVVSGRNNYTLSTEDREAFYKDIADEKKINDALLKERTQKVYTAEANRLMDRFISSELTLDEVTNSKLPEAKADGYESQFSQKYFVDLLEKKADKDETKKSNPQVLSQLYLGFEDRQKTYYENYSDVLKAYENEDLTNSDYRIAMNRLNDDTTVGAVVKTGTDTLEEAFKDGVFDDNGYTAAMNEYWDTVKARNLDPAGITELSKNLIVKNARKGKDAMQWLGVENEGANRFNRYNSEQYLESNRIEEVDDPLWERHVDEAKTMAREDYDNEIQKAAIAELGRPFTDNELAEYKQAHSYDDFQRSQQDIGDQLENYDAPEDFKIANTDFDRGIIAEIFNKNNLDVDVKNIFKKASRDATAFLIQDARGKFYYASKGLLMAWDEGAGVWRYQ